MIFHYFSISLFQWLRKYYFNTSRLWRTETDVLRCLCLFLSSTSEPKHWHSESVWLQSLTSQSCPDHLLQLFLFNNMLQSHQLGSSIKRDIKIITSIKHSCIKHKFVYVRTSCKRMKNLMKVFPVSTQIILLCYWYKLRSKPSLTEKIFWYVEISLLSWSQWRGNSFIIINDSLSQPSLINCWKKSFSKPCFIQSFAHFTHFFLHKISRIMDTKHWCRHFTRQHDFYLTSELSWTGQYHTLLSCNPLWLHFQMTTNEYLKQWNVLTPV